MTTPGERRVPDPVVAPAPGAAGAFATTGMPVPGRPLPNDRPAPLPRVAAVTGFAAVHAAAGRSASVSMLPRATGVRVRVLDVTALVPSPPARSPPERSPP